MDQTSGNNDRVGLINWIARGKHREKKINANNKEWMFFGHFTDDTNDMLNKLPQLKI